MPTPEESDWLAASGRALLFRLHRGIGANERGDWLPWRASNAGHARGMYEQRDFSAMSILADALQDAGCENEEVLNHCRDPKFTHVRGCWVVDLLLATT